MKVLKLVFLIRIFVVFNQFFIFLIFLFQKNFRICYRPLYWCILTNWKSFFFAELYLLCFIVSLVTLLKCPVFLPVIMYFSNICSILSCCFFWSHFCPVFLYNFCGMLCRWYKNFLFRNSYDHLIPVKLIFNATFVEIFLLISAEIMKKLQNKFKT